MTISKQKILPCIGKFRNCIDKNFRMLLHTKIEKAQSLPEPIFWWCGCFFFADGELRYETPNLLFEPYTPTYIEHIESDKGKREMADIERNEPWFKKYWDEHPDDSLADAIRLMRRTDSARCCATPQLEADLMLLDIEDGCLGARTGEIGIDPIRGFFILDDHREDISWEQYYALRGEKFLKEKHQFVFQGDAAFFSKICASTEEELKKLDSQREILFLQAIQKNMLDVLREGERLPGIWGECKRRVNEAIKVLEKSLGIEAESQPATVRKEVLTEDIEQAKPKNGSALKPEQITFIQGAGNAKKTNEIIDDFRKRFGFMICDKTVQKYRNPKPAK